jgi:general secretion pathway protein J
MIARRTRTAPSLARYGSRRRSGLHTRGFTLLEVMIAVAILALIGGLTYKSFEAAWDLKTRIERAAERDQTVRGALTRMSREISMAFLSEHFDHKRYRARPTIFKLRDGRREADLLFTSFGHERLVTDAKESDQAAFEYALGPSEDGSGKRDLFRRVKTVIDEDIEREGEKGVLAEDVLAFSVECWDPKDREWRTDWNSASTERVGQVLLPPRVRLTLALKDENGKERTYTTQTQIFLGQPLDF